MNASQAHDYIVMVNALAEIFDEPNKLTRGQMVEIARKALKEVGAL